MSYSLDKKLAFKLVNPETNHEYRIYENGQIEGFNEPLVVFNYLSIMMSEYELHLSKNNKGK